MSNMFIIFYLFFFFQAEDGIRDHCVTGVQTYALPILKTRAFRRSWSLEERPMGRALPRVFTPGAALSLRPLAGGHRARCWPHSERPRPVSTPRKSLQ